LLRVISGLAERSSRFPDQWVCLSSFLTPPAVDYQHMVRFRAVVRAESHSLETSGLRRRKIAVIWGPAPAAFRDKLEISKAN
jgi:hypothetical protein